MVQPKYSPEEALQRIKLMMEYDSSKTLTENKKVIKEQSSSCQNSMTYSELREKADEAGNIVKKMDAVFVRMGYGEERASELYTIVKSLVDKNVLDDLTNECVNAIDKFKQNFKTTGSRGWFVGGFDLEKKLNEFISGYYSDDEESKRYLNATLKLLNNQTSTIKKEDKPEEKKKPKTGKDGGTKQQTPQIPSELKDVEGVKKFQDWLDKNKAGWATGFPGGKLNQAGGYGRFGPRTTKAWSSYGPEYIKGGSVQPEVTPEVSGEVQTVDVSSTDF